MNRTLCILACCVLCAASTANAQEAVDVVFVRPYGIKVCKVYFSINGQELFGLYNEQQTRIRLQPGRYTVKTDGSYFTCASADRIERPLVIPSDEKEVTFAYLGTTYPTQISQIRRLFGPLAQEWSSKFESVTPVSANPASLVPAPQASPKQLAPAHARITIRPSASTSTDAKVIRFNSPQECSQPEAPKTAWHDDPLTFDLPAGPQAFELNWQPYEPVYRLCRMTAAVKTTPGKHYVLEYGWQFLTPSNSDIKCTIGFSESDENGRPLPNEGAKLHALEFAPFTGKCT
ncbi:MAG TPA: hypothetical protein PLW86_04340 [Rhodocyclaceae bacterium]|nr:hypothetical protein [Rhodocyclaceae bacterium]